MIAITTRKRATKKIVMDIVPSQRRSIKSVPIEHEEEEPVKLSRKKVAPPEPEPVVEYNEETVEPIFPKKTRTPKRNTGSLKYIISFVVIFVSLAVIGIALSLSYSKALITITPKVAFFDVDGMFTAKKSLPESSTDDLKYEVITTTDQIVETIPAVKGALVQTKAKGAVNLYNSSATSQVLVAGTRLSATSGLIYRTVSTVTVPSKKGTIPGSISANIIADQAGANYNINISDLKGDFKLPGYKGNTKYDLFYARLKNNLVGGYSGNKISIDKVAQTNKTDAMKDVLKDRLMNKIKDVVPKDYVLYETAYNIEYETPEPVMKGTDSAEITVKGTAYGAIFNSDTLIKYIAGKEIKKFPSDTFKINGDRELTFKISNIKDFSVKKATPLVFTLKGPISITGTFSEGKLKDDLKGKKAKLGNTIFAKYPAISNAFAQITPFWMSSFPDDVNNITIEYKTPTK